MNHKKYIIIQDLTCETTIEVQPHWVMELYHFFSSAKI